MRGEQHLSVLSEKGQHMALFSLPEEARPLWTLWQVLPARSHQDDEDKWQCDGCDEYIRARDHSARYRLQATGSKRLVGKGTKGVCRLTGTWGPNAPTAKPL